MSAPTCQHCFEVFHSICSYVSKHLLVVESSWNVMAHGDAGEGKLRGNWRMEWVASTLTLPRNMVYPALLPLMRTPQLPVVDWSDAPADLNGFVRLTERRNLVSARVPSHFKRSLPTECTMFILYIHLLCTYSLLHVSVPCTPSSGRTIVPFT
jgi:hypothetical protein